VYTAINGDDLENVEGTKFSGHI